MPETAPAKVKIEKISLESLVFKSLPEFTPEGKEIKFDVALDWSVEKPENLRYETVCTIKVNAASEKTPLQIVSSCRVTSSVTSNEDVGLLNDFSNFGAVFNAIVFFRDLIRDVTGRTEFGQLILPLIDITQGGKEARIPRGIGT